MRKALTMNMSNPNAWFEFMLLACGLVTITRHSNVPSLLSEHRLGLNPDPKHQPIAHRWALGVCPGISSQAHLSILERRKTSWPYLSRSLKLANFELQSHRAYPLAELATYAGSNFEQHIQPLVASGNWKAPKLRKSPHTNSQRYKRCQSWKQQLCFND